MKEQPINILWINFVKVIAIIAVIQIHVASPLMHKYNIITESYWWIGVTYDSMARMAVALFLW